MMSKVKTYWNTVKYLKPVQILSRVSGKLKPKSRHYYDNYPSVRAVHLALPDIDCEKTFCDRFRVEKMFEGQVCLLNQMVGIDYSYAYTHSLKPLIHNNVYYFEYGVVLAAEYRRTNDVRYLDLFKDCYREYLDSDANVQSSYIMSLHIPNVLIALDMFGKAIDDDFKKKIFCELFSMYRFLEQHLETHLLANHLFEDLKALTIASWLFGEDKKCSKYLSALKRQVNEQILADGVHYELSPMYHKLILEDLLRIATLSRCVGFPSCDWLKPTIQKMANAMFSIERGFGRTPLFNDSGDNVAKTCDSLLNAAKSVLGCNIDQSENMVESGYYKLYDGGLALIIDCGKVGVDYQPAHGHCDCLSFELSMNGKPLFINQGTYEYQGEKRMYYKKVCAHNTVTVNGHEQNECWGGFRIGRRISIVEASLKGQVFKGSYKNYFGENHSRSVSLTNGTFEVLDITDGRGISFLHIAPGYSYSEGRIMAGDSELCFVESVDCECEYVVEGDLCEYAFEFGKVERCSCLVFRWEADNKQHGYRITFKNPDSRKML